jgi:hypothetical protein
MMSRKPVPLFHNRYGVGEVAVAAIIFTVALAVVFSFSVARARSQLTDFAAHWTACRLIGNNPFDLAAITKLQEHLAAHKTNIMVMGNPPWTVLLFFPFSLLPYPYANALWVITSAFILWFVTIYFWRAFGQKDNTIALALTFSFAPTLTLLTIAQIDAVLMLAMVAFLVGVNRKNWLLADVGLALFSVKPHLIILPALSITLWALKNRNWRLLAGTASILGAMTGSVLLLNHAVLSQWLAYLHLLLPFGENLPTIANTLASAHPLLRFAPLLCGTAFAVYRFFRIPNPEWSTELPLIVAVGLVTSFYASYYDQVLMVPFLLYAGACGNRKVFWTLFCIADALFFLCLFETFPYSPVLYYFLVCTATYWLVISLVSLPKKAAIA